MLCFPQMCFSFFFRSEADLSCYVSHCFSLSQRHISSYSSPKAFWSIWKICLGFIVISSFKSDFCTACSFWKAPVTSYYFLLLFSTEAASVQHAFEITLITQLPSGISAEIWAQKDLPRSLKAYSLTTDISSLSVHNRLFWAGNLVKMVSARHCWILLPLVVGAPKSLQKGKVRP